MSTAATPRIYRPEDLLTMPDGKRFELVDGQLVEDNMSAWSSYVGGVLFGRILAFSTSQHLGWVFPEGTSYRCFPDDPNQVRRADVSFVAGNRVSAAQMVEFGHIPVFPDLAVEVVSPNDLHYEVHEKVQEFLRAGTKLVWVVDPEFRIVEVHRAQGAGSILREQDDLDGEDVIPGFRCRIADLFQAPPGVTQASASSTSKP